jgi:hypothetical protein
MTVGKNASEFGRASLEDSEALDGEARYDAAFWSKERVEFDAFRLAHKGQPQDEVEKVLHKWLRHHGIDMDDQEVTSHAAKISAGEEVELVTLPEVSPVVSGTGEPPEGK